MRCYCQRLRFKVLAKGKEAGDRPHRLLARCAACHRQYVCSVAMLEGGLAPSCEMMARSVDEVVRAGGRGLHLTLSMDGEHEPTRH